MSREKDLKLEQPHLVEDIPAHGGAVGQDDLQRSLPTHTSLSAYETMSHSTTAALGHTEVQPALCAVLTTAKAGRASSETPPVLRNSPSGLGASCLEATPTPAPSPSAPAGAQRPPSGSPVLRRPALPGPAVTAALPSSHPRILVGI